jgi:hypothetical protein
MGRWPGGPLVRVVGSVEIDRPASEVWAYVADYGNDPSWRGPSPRCAHRCPDRSRLASAQVRLPVPLATVVTGWSRFQARPLPSGQRWHSPPRAGRVWCSRR